MKSFDYISSHKEIIYSRILYFVFPKKIKHLTKNRETLAVEVHEFIDKYIEQVDSKYKEERILYKEHVKDEKEFIIRRNSNRKISVDQKVEMEKILDRIN